MRWPFKFISLKKWSARVPYFHKLATDSDEALHLYSTRVNQAVGFTFCLNDKKIGKACHRQKSITMQC